MTKPSPKLSDTVYEFILGQVMVGAFAVQSRLPAETELAARLGVSRPVVREALRRLREDGLICSRKGSGSVVTRQPDRAIPGFAPVSSIADIQRCFIFREALEGEAAALAARYHDSRTLETIRKALAALQELSERREVGTDVDFSFHYAIAEATANHFFGSTLLAIRTQIAAGIQLNRSLSLVQSPERRAVVQSEHAAVYAAIAIGDEEGARAAMRMHIERARRRVFEGDDSVRHR